MNAQQCKIVFLAVLGLLTIMNLTWAADKGEALTGKWRCDDRGTYYVRQVGYKVWWFGEVSPTNPAWSNVAHGEIVGNQLHLDWTDVPKGRVGGNGRLVLEISEGGRQLRALKKSGGFGGNIWTLER